MFPRDYILYVGKRQGYKNFNLFIKSVAGILRKEKNLNVICIGGGKFRANRFHYLMN